MLLACDGAIPGDPVPRASGIIKSLSLGLGPAGFTGGSSSGSSSSWEVPFFLALINSQANTPVTMRRRIHSAAKQPTAAFRLVKS